MDKRQKQIEIEKKKKIKQLPGVPFDPLDNDYPKNHRKIRFFSFFLIHSALPPLVLDQSQYSRCR